jgi:Ser/Thr protein kinase RdoA (MazF antagonist)
MNNDSHLVTTSAGSYVLKTIRNTGMMERLRFEHALLEALSRQDLPFAFPAPVHTRTGETSANLDDATPAVLTRLLTGGPAWRGDPAIARISGRALAMLDMALEGVVLDPAVHVPSTVDELARNHPAIADPAAATSHLLADHALAFTVSRVLARAEREWKRQTAGAPEQIIHGDFFPPNVLIADGQVSAVLDFEFSGTGHRAMDLAVGLVAFGAASRSDLPTWELLASFAAGYLEVMPLSRQEIERLPALILMREAGSFVHWLGRTMQGLTTREDIESRANRLLALDRWLDVNGFELVERLQNIARTGLHPSWW